jgi:hypothetical protein
MGRKRMIAIAEIGEFYRKGKEERKAMGLEYCAKMYSARYYMVNAYDVKDRALKRKQAKEE